MYIFIQNSLQKHSLHRRCTAGLVGHMLPFYSILVTVSALILWAFAWPPAPSML